MSNVFRVVALDVDGTIAFHDRLADEICDAIKDLRYFGVRIAIVTGRTLSELNRVYPQLRGLADVMVAENGAVLVGPTGQTRLLASPVSAKLADALVARGIHLIAGEVLLGCSADHVVAVSEEINRLGVGCALIRNRHALMVLPAGVTKGSGLTAAMDELGLSCHNVLAVGDAENDHPLFSSAEYAVAVADATSAVRDHADLVLSEPGVGGSVGLLRGPIARGTERALSNRRFLRVGSFTDNGDQATIPGSQATVLLTGASGRGKSYAAGLVVERAIQAGYQVLLIDPEGDHAGLGELRNLEYVDARDGEPFLASAMHTLRSTGSSVALGLSALSPDAFGPAMTELAGAIRELRGTGGVPHWIVFDEAHRLLGDDTAWTAEFDPVFGGHLVVTYQPELLAPDVMGAVDVVLSVAAPVDDLLGGQSGPPTGVSAPFGVGSLLRAMDRGPARQVSFDRRSTTHIRHLRKYGGASLPRDKWFWFRNSSGRPQPAASLVEFETALSAADPNALEWHLVHGDFSRWIRGTLQDRTLAEVVASAERDSVARRRAELEQARDLIRSAVRNRYLGVSGDDLRQDIKD